METPQTSIDTITYAVKKVKTSRGKQKPTHTLSLKTRLLRLKLPPKKGDNLGDIHRGIPTLEWQGIQAPGKKVPVPVELAKSLLNQVCPPTGYLNKTLVVVGEGNHSNGEALLTCAYIYDATFASLVTYDFR